MKGNRFSKGGDRLTRHGSGPEGMPEVEFLSSFFLSSFLFIVLGVQSDLKRQEIHNFVFYRGFKERRLATLRYVLRYVRYQVFFGFGEMVMFIIIFSNPFHPLSCPSKS